MGSRTRRLSDFVLGQFSKCLKILPREIWPLPGKKDWLICSACVLPVWLEMEGNFVEKAPD
jgi:hypothetical protein